MNNLKKIKLIILDVDGVLTDGKKYYGLDGMPFAKTFCDKDWTSIKRFKSMDIFVIFLTGDKTINEAIGINRNIPVYLTRGKDKSEIVDELISKYNCDASEMCYVGDDLFDIGIMKKVGHSYCTYDSPTMVKDVCNVLSVSGGENVVLNLFETLELNGTIEKIEYANIIDKIYDLDKKEIF